MPKSKTIYPYITNDNRENRQFYMYSKFCGSEFLQQYNNYRMNAQMRLSLKFIEERHNVKSDFESVLRDFETLALRSEHQMVKELFDLVKRKQSFELRSKMEKLVHSFEIRKRIYGEYDENNKPVTDDYKGTEPYLAFAATLSYCIVESDNLKYLNTLLKLTDTILSFEEDLSGVEAMLFIHVLNEEQQAINNLMSRKGLIL
jgi:hypothetical protein